MIKIKYSSDVMKFMSMFDMITGAKIKDCLLVEEVIFFIVEPGQIGKAIGKKGLNIQKLKNLLKNKEFKIVEFHPDVVEFVRNLFYPIKIEQIVLNNDIVEVKASDLKTRGLLIGRSGKNLRNNEAIANRYFNIKEIRVI